jgi:hypothetical protein
LGFTTGAAVVVAPPPLPGSIGAGAVLVPPPFPGSIGGGVFVVVVGGVVVGGV